MGEQSGETTQQKGAGRLVLAMFAIFIGSLNQYAGTALPVFRDTLQQYYGLNDRGFGLLTAVGLVAGTLGALTGGVLSHRFGPRRMLFASFGVLLVSFLLAGIDASLPLMGVALAISGFINSILFVNLQTYLFERFPGRRRQIVSLQLAVPATMMALVNLLAEWLLGQVKAGRVSFSLVLHGPFLLLAPLILLGLLLFRGGPATAAPEETTPLTWRSLLGTFHFPVIAWWLIGLMVLHGTADALGFSWAPKILGNAASFPEQHIKPGYAVALASVIYTLSRVGLTMLPERFGARAMLMLPGLLGGGLLTVGLLTHHQGLAAAGFIAGAGLWSLEYPAFLATLVAVERQRNAAAVSASLLVGGLISLPVTYAIGWVGDALGPARAWMGMLIPAGLFMLTGLCGGLWLLQFRQATVNQEPAQSTVEAIY